jgi:hypothetical protein
MARVLKECKRGHQVVDHTGPWCPRSGCAHALTAVPESTLKATLLREAENAEVQMLTNYVSRCRGNTCERGN